MTPFEFLLCGALVFVSALMASSEIALFSLSRFQLRALRETLRPRMHREIRRLISDPAGLLVTILITNEVVNISLTAIITGWISRLSTQGIPFLNQIPHWVIDTTLSTLVATPIILFLCEITPKVIGARANQLIASATAVPVGLIYDAFRPVRTVIRAGIALASGRPIPFEPSPAKDAVLRESEFLMMVEEGHKEGAIHESEMGLIRKVFELDDTTVQEICKPMSRLLTLPADTTIRSATQTLRSKRYSRIPVVDSARRVVGILYSKDLIRAKLDPQLLDMSIASLLKKPIFVPPKMRLNTLFRRFKQERTHMALVQEPGGPLLGAVTMNDVLNALFEDLIEDEEGQSR